MIDLTKIKKILIVRLGKLGDLITTSFVFDAINYFDESIKIDVLTFTGNAELLSNNPNINNIYFFRRNPLFFFTILKCNINNYDLIIDFNDNYSKTSIILFRIISSKYKAAYDFDNYSKYANILIKQPPQNNSHIIERIDYFLRQIGFEYPDNLVKPKLYLSAEGINYAGNIFSGISADKKIIALNLSAGAKIRYWNVNSWISLIKIIRAKFNNFVFLLLCLEKDNHIKNLIINELSSDFFIEGNKYTFIQFAALISKSDFLISPDTSAVHIASAFSVPVVALYPSPEWNFISWRPYQKFYKAIKSDSEDINNISPEKIFTAFIELIKEINNQI